MLLSGGGGSIWKGQSFAFVASAMTEGRIETLMRIKFVFNLLSVGLSLLWNSH